MIVLERLASARFFFNLVSDTEMIHDEEGLELPSEGDVVGHIAHALEDLYWDGSLASAEWEGWRIDVADCTGQTLLSAALGYPYLECTFPFELKPCNLA
jgi:hypothetical protein